MCRVAAVKGAVYVLRQPIHSLLLDPETKQCKGIQTGSGQVSLPTSQTDSSLAVCRQKGGIQSDMHRLAAVVYMWASVSGCVQA